MQNLINPFESLRYPGIPDGDIIRNNFDTIEVYNDRKEIVKILVTDIGNGQFAFGYDIYFLDGRHVCRLPSSELGLCTSANNAVLYFLGYIKKHHYMFSENVIHEVDKLIGRYRQLSLF